MKYLSFSSGESSKAEQLVLCVDVSGSMNWSDFKPSRLGGAIKAGQALLHRKKEQSPRDQVGIVAYHTEARTVKRLLPLDRELDCLLRSLGELTVGSSTNLEAGLQEVAALFTICSSGRPQKQTRSRLGRLRKFLFDEGGVEQGNDTSERTDHAEFHRRVIVLSDGGHGSGVGTIRAASKLKENGVTINTIGIGGSPLTVGESGLKAIASIGSDGQPLYVFIKDTESLITTFESLAVNIRPL